MINRKNYCTHAIQLYQGNDMDQLNADMLTSKAFIDFCQEHRILSRMEKMLNPYFLQGDAKDYFISQITASRARALKQIAVLNIIAQAFNENNITWLAFKGPVLSQVLFEDPTIRASKDLDIWVPHAEIHKAHDILIKCNFFLTTNNHNSKEKSFFSFLQKDDIYFHKLTNVQLELHWNLIPGVEFTDDIILNNKKHILFYQHNIPVFNAEMEFIYLCAHAGKSHWGRLSWLFDVYDYDQKIPLNQDLLFSLAMRCRADCFLMHGLHIATHFFNKTNMYFHNKNKGLQYVNTRKIRTIEKNIELTGNIDYFAILKRTIDESILAKNIKILVSRVFVFFINKLKIRR